MADIATLSDQVDRLLTKKGSDEHKLRVNNAYYESAFRPQAIGMAVPPAMKRLVAKIGWPRLYVQSLEERLNVEGFRLANETSTDDRLWSWWQYNNLDAYSGLGHTEALVHGRAFITVSAPDPSNPLLDPNMPIIKVESAKNLYVEIHPVTGRVTRGIRTYTDPDRGVDDRVALYLPNATYLLRKGRPGETKWVVEHAVEHDLGFVTVIPLLNQSRIDDELGSSEITPEIRSVTDAAARLLMNMQATAELMAIPQRVLFGLAEDEINKVTGEKSFDAYLANILAFEDPDGKIAQFAAAELRNFAEGMAVLRTEAAGYTGLPPQYLAFSQDNPASADAIRASESRLVQKAERKTRMFGEAWEQAMTIAMRVMRVPMPADIHRLETTWQNPATPTFSSQADAVVKLATAETPSGLPILPVQAARVALGYTDEQRKQMEGWDKESPRSRLADMYGQTGSEIRDEE